MHLTGIEMLKGRRASKGTKVQIAPYWNWNQINLAAWQSAIKFKLHLTGIEITLCAQRFATGDSFKLHLTGIEIVIERHTDKRVCVQIAPYWNWNVDWTCSECQNSEFKLRLTGIEICIMWPNISSNPRSNCTLLELKSISGVWVEFVRDAGSNCTLLELKSTETAPGKDGKGSSNCTLLELKYLCYNL